MAHFPKPPEGSWTAHFGLDTGPMSYDDSISPDYFEVEREAVFGHSWLNVGRVEQAPNAGTFFVKPIDAVRSSVVVVRDGNGELRAWRFALGDHFAFLQQETFEIGNDESGLTPLQLDVWEGFVFVNFDEGNSRSLEDYLGKFAAGMKGYPFDKMTHVYKFQSHVRSNWKLYIDAFAEFYHAPVLHAKQYVSDESAKLMGYGFEALHYDVDGPHGMVSSWGGMAPPKDPMMVKPTERVLRSGNFGPWDKPDIPELATLPSGLNPTKHRAWGLDSYVFFPNFMIVVWEPGWYLTYHYWPTAYNEHIFEGTLYMAPPKTPSDRMRQELAAVTFKEFSLQDCNTLEATQTMLETRAVSRFPLCDQEVLLRHLHTSAQRFVEDVQRRSGAPSLSATHR
ncbi:aromatic ring-hydroxylating dioxygenase subunit alpha [Aldersonia sp. NBC_00410]|uniref:RHO alpha subunit C-terminal catalytic domain-containing protein n=1 Tax=Aldersonia sp. NBC_00410 TaxID=2975954 RepID=UPI00225AD293|nr:SRPBCC family protein [Aldersonia sp. NBC_00410]MCX5044284.1 aromatic ring-hydroxylating dioxygenase subunit alpha [Aldersonia sp. NBC_00410]